jgi:hypothetical protein
MAQGFAKPVASQRLLRIAIKMTLEQQMRPFLRHLHFSKWLACLKAPSAFQALREHQRISHQDCVDLMDEIYHSKNLFSLEDSFKKRYAATNYALNTLIRKALKEYNDTKKLIKRYTFGKAWRIQEKMHSQLHNSTYILEAHVVIKMRRASVDDHQQGIFGCLDYQFSLFESRSCHVHQEMQYSIAVMQKSDGPLIRSHIKKIKSLTLAIKHQCYEYIQDLWERHISLMSPQQLERYGQMAQSFWSTWSTQFTLEQAWVAGTPPEITHLRLSISYARRSFAIALEAKRRSGQALRLSAEHEELQEQAIKAMQRLEEICPLQPPMSKQAFQKILGLEDPSPPSSVPSSEWSRLLSDLDEVKVEPVARLSRRVVFQSSL